MPAAGVDFITVEEAEVGAIDEELVSFGGVFFFEEVGEGKLAGADVVGKFPRALGGAENMEKVFVSEDSWKVADGAVLRNADLGAILEFDRVFFHAVGKFKGSIVEDGVFNHLLFHDVGDCGDNGWVIDLVELFFFFFFFSGGGFLRTECFMTPSEPEENGPDTEAEGGVDVAKAVGSTFCRSGEARARRVTWNEDDFDKSADGGFVKVAFLNLDFEDLDIGASDFRRDIGLEA